MKKINLIKFLIVILFLAACSKPEVKDYKDASLPVEERVEALLSQMTIEEKVAQTISITDHASMLDKNDKLIPGQIKKLFKNGVGAFTSLSNGCIRDKKGKFELTIEQNVKLNNEIQKAIIESSRFGIPVLIVEEGLHGYVANQATSFPQAIGLGSMWDTELMEKIFNSVALEMRSRGVHQALSPVLGLGREPRWGRIEETYGEDPYHVSKCGISFVKGLQGFDETYLDENHIAATLKHFAVHSQPEGGRNCAPGNYSERVLRENFYYPFEMVVKEANPLSVMASYNEIDGVPSHANYNLLTSILKNEWGFDGYVIADQTGVSQLFDKHCIASDSAEAAEIAIKAGVDMDLPNSKTCFKFLVESVKSGKVGESVLNEAVRRVLRVKFQLGLFENPYANLDKALNAYKNSGHKELALQAAHKSTILLKNENKTLPLNIDNIKNLAVIGPNAADIHLGGYSAEPRVGISVLSGLKEKGKEKFNVHYAKGCKIIEGKVSFWTDEPASESNPEDDKKLIAEAVTVAKKSDVVVLVLGGNESTCREAWWNTHLGDRDDLGLIGMQNELAEAILATGKPVIVILINGRPLEISYLKENVPAILEAWYAGQETGIALSDILFGDVNPSGKLPVTFPANVGQLPVYYNKKPSVYREYLFGDTIPLYPFGYGLSYTTFSYNNLKVSPETIAANQNAIVTVDITNTGDRDGEEVAQMYIRDKVSSVTRPIKELKGFKRVPLKAGETKTVSFTISPDKLQFYNIDMKRVVEPGEFEILVGTNSTNLLPINLVVK